MTKIEDFCAPFKFFQICLYWNIFYFHWIWHDKLDYCYLDVAIRFSSDPAIESMGSLNFYYSGCNIVTNNFQAIQNHTEIVLTLTNGTVTRQKVSLQQSTNETSTYSSPRITVVSYENYGTYRCEVNNPRYFRNPVISKTSKLSPSITSKSKSKLYLILII